MIATPAASDDGSRIPCRDLIDRHRSVGVWTSPDGCRVVLVAPPAETALLTPAQARELARELNRRARQAELELRRTGQIDTTGLAAAG